MGPSRGMGDIMPSKMGKGVKKARRDNTDFTQYKKGGEVKKPTMTYETYTKTGKPSGMKTVTVNPKKVKK